MKEGRIVKAAVAALGVFIALAPTIARADEASLYAAAQKEGEVVWYTTLIYDTAVRPLIDAFEKKYPGVAVKFSRADSVPTAIKILTEERAGKVQADVFDGTETAAPLIQAGFVEQYKPPNLDAFPPQVRDPNGYWYSYIYYFLTPAINTNLIPLDQAPKNAQDLLDPKWRGKIAWNMSGSTGAIAFIAGIEQMMGDEKGTAYLKELAKQHVVTVGATARAMVDDVAAGEYPMALAIFNHHTVMSAEKGAPVTWLKLDPIVAQLALTGITKGAPHPNAARLFIDFLLSEDTQKLFAQLGFLPTMSSVPAKVPTLKPEDGHYTPIYLTQDIVTKNFSRWKQLYDDLFQ
jgi:ABC-type Fe3+ transport system substrate-binding protein